jgi:hypothetical protein
MFEGVGKVLQRNDCIGEWLGKMGKDILIYLLYEKCTSLRRLHK